MSSSEIPSLPGPPARLVRSIRDHLWTYAEDELRQNPQKQVAIVLENGNPVAHSENYVWEYKVVRLADGSFDRQTWFNGVRVR